jgi:hypothetical protein
MLAGLLSDVPIYVAKFPELIALLCAEGRP